MPKHLRTVRIERDQNLERAVADVAADGTPRLLVRDRAAVAVLISPGDYAELREAAEDVWTMDDPDRARRALDAGVGALARIDRVQFLRDVRAAPAGYSRPTGLTMDGEVRLCADVRPGCA